MGRTSEQFISIKGKRRAQGNGTVPGDKSISHRALFAAFLSGGRGKLENCSLAADCLSTMTVLGSMGMDCSIQADGSVLAAGPEPGSWNRGQYRVDAGNSGTTARLLMGAAAFLAPGGQIVISGDESLSRRPMERVARYLRPMGLNITYLKVSGHLPLTVEVAGGVGALRQEIEEPSAQVKSAVLLAGLAAPGGTEVVQRVQTRDHTEVMLAALGADVAVGPTIRLAGGSRLNFPQVWRIPGDFSGAAWWLALAAVSGQVRLEGVGVNPTRLGFAEILRAMGARLSMDNPRFYNGEPVADIQGEEGELQGVEVPPELIPSCIDELPALAVVAAFARGQTVIRGAGELRHKESDRIQHIARMLAAFGADYDLLPDGFIIRGKAKLRAAEVISWDHRIVMAAAVLAALVPGESHIGDIRWLDTSYPGFLADLDKLSTRPGENLV